MFDVENIAESVTYWAGIGGAKLPPQLAQAVQLFETFRYVETGHHESFGIEDVTTDNAEEKLREFAGRIALSGVPGEQAPSPLEKAKKLAVNEAARWVVNVARQVIDDFIAQLTPEFDRHVAAYVGAVQQLPADLTAESLLAAGSRAVAAYDAAKNAARVLSRFDKWVTDTARVQGTVDVEVCCRLLKPESVTQLAALDTAREKQASSALRALNPIWFSAARNGIPFGINSMREAVRLRKELYTVSVAPKVAMTSR